MTDIQPLSAEELAAARADLMGFALESGNAARVGERLLATIDAKDAEITKLREAIQEHVESCPDAVHSLHDIDGRQVWP